MSISAESPLISVIVVTWNSEAYLPECLTCLEAQTFQDFEMILVDNASTDGTLPGLASQKYTFPLRVERLGKNMGFAAANNAGARLAEGKWLALLNSDAFAEPDWLESLVEATEQFPNFSFFGSRQIQANQPILMDGAGDIFHVSGLAWRRFNGGKAECLGLEAEEIFSPCAAAALYRRDAFFQAGGFDEDFFSYHEDVDLGFRLRLEGFHSMYIPQAVVKHIGSASTGPKSAFAIYHGHRNLVWTYLKDMPTPLFWLYLPVHLLMNLFFLFYFSFAGQGKAIWKAKWEALQGFKRMVRKRKEIQGKRAVPTKSLYRLMDRDLLSPWRTRVQRQQSLKGGE